MHDEIGCADRVFKLFCEEPTWNLSVSRTLPDVQCSSRTTSFSLYSIPENATSIKNPLYIHRLVTWCRFDFNVLGRRNRRSVTQNRSAERQLTRVDFLRAQFLGRHAGHSRRRLGSDDVEKVRAFYRIF